MWLGRYRHPAPHLRLRRHVPDYGYAVATYYPETGRYGSGPCMAAAETLFAAHSAAVPPRSAVRPTQPRTPEATARGQVGC